MKNNIKVHACYPNYWKDLLWVPSNLKYGKNCNWRLHLTISDHIPYDLMDTWIFSKSPKNRNGHSCSDNTPKACPVLSIFWTTCSKMQWALMIIERSLSSFLPWPWNHPLTPGVNPWGGPHVALGHAAPPEEQEYVRELGIF